MATASLYGNNDYTPLQYRPYELPVNDIMRAFVAKNQFWEQGAARVKSVYENALNLDLTLDQNKKYKEEFMTKAQEEMKKLSSMDLSDVDVQKQGMSIFSPLLKDKMVAIDDQLTKRRKSIFQEAESYKTKKLSKDGVEGEGYNQKNLAYALDGFEEFNSMTNRDEKTLTELYNKLGNRKYTPAHDITSELSKVKNLCEGTTNISQPVAANYLYLDRQSKSGATSNEMSLCLQEGLSDLAKQQMTIDGWTQYKNNPSALYNDYKSQYLNGLDVEEQALEGRIAGMKSGSEKYDKDELKKLEDTLNQTKILKSKKLDEFNKMTGPNGEEYIMKNFNTLSSSVYQNIKLQRMGAAFQDVKITRELLPNTAGIAQYNAHQRYILQERASELRKGEEEFKARLEGRMLDDNLKTIEGNVVDEPNMEYNSTMFANERQQTFNDYSKNYRQIGQYLESLKGGSTSSIKVNDAYILNFANEQSKKPIEQRDKEFMRLMDGYNKSKANFERIDLRNKMYDETVEKELGNDYRALHQKKVVLSDGTIITGKDISSFPIRKTRGSDDKVADEIVTINGKDYNLSYTNANQDVSKIKSLYRDNSEILDKVKKIKDELVKKEYYNAGSYVQPRVNMDKRPDLNDEIVKQLGLPGIGKNAHNEKGGYRVMGHDRTGSSILVTPLDADGNPITDKKTLDNYLTTTKSFQNSPAIKYINGVPAIELKNMLPQIANIPSEETLQKIEDLRLFKGYMEKAFSKNKMDYMTSYDLKGPDGTPTQYPAFFIDDFNGEKIKVVAIKSGDQVLLRPERLVNGKWDSSYPSFNTPDELVTYFK